jgi:beta-N-acetylhexosaminidase
MKVKFLFYSSLVLASMLYGAHGASDAEPLDDGWKQLSLREKIGQTVVMSASEVVANKSDEQLAAYLKKYPVGGMYDGEEVIHFGAMPISQIADRIKRVRKASSIPLLICGDMEAGAGANAVGFTWITKLSGVGATGSKSLAYDFGRATALEARSIGFNWLLAPVADLVQNPFNYLVADRSISDDPRVATPLLISVMRGYQDSDIAATAKHFPGDGVDYRNQHLTTSCNGLTRVAWKKNHGAVFQALIDNGQMSIMAGHISLPCYQSDSEFVQGRYLPATLSHDLVTKLLKQDMGFKGVVVSDAVVMGGFTKFYGDDACVRSVAAGVDMLLWPPERYFDDMELAIQSGRVPMARLDDAVQRIWRMKQQLGLLNPNTPAARPMSDNDQNFVKKTAREVAEKSITLVRDRNQLLPLNPMSVHSVAIVPISNSEQWMKRATDHLQAVLSARGITSTIHQGLWLEDLSKVAAENDLVIYLVGNIPLQVWAGPAQKDTWTCDTAGQDKTVVVSLDNPFHSDEYMASPVYINAYETSDVVIDALVRGLFGEITFTGKSQVDLNMFRKFDLDRRANRTK